LNKGIIASIAEKFRGNTPPRVFETVRGIIKRLITVGYL